MSLKLVVLFLSIFSFICSAQVNIVVEPRNLSVGDSGTITLISSEKNFEIKSLPQIDGVSWQTSMTSSLHQNINGRNTTKESYTFVVEKSGELALGKVEYTVNGVSGHIDAGRITVSALPDLSEQIFYKISYNQKDQAPEFLFVGERLLLEIKLFVDRTLDMKTGVLPDLQVANVNDLRFIDLSNHRQEASTPIYSQRVLEERINSITYNVHSFYIAFAPIKSTDIDIRLKQSWQLNLGKRPNRIHGFFSAPYMGKSFSLDMNLPQIKVKSLPESSNENAIFLGLVGDYSLNVALDKSEVMAGEAVSLMIDIKTSQKFINGMESLLVPEIILPNFRVYPGEIIREHLPSGVLARINYLIVPLDETSKINSLLFSTFNPKTKSYENFGGAFDLKVKAVAKQVGNSLVVYGDKVAGANLGNEEKKLSNLLFLKTSESGALFSNLYKNCINYFILCLVIMVFLCIIVFLRKHREKMLENSDYSRYFSVRQRRRTLVNKLAKEENLALVMMNELVPWLIDFYKKPKGLSLNELSKEINDAEFVDLLNKAEVAQYMPGAGQDIDRTKVLNKFKKLYLILFIFLSGNIFADDFAGGVKSYEQMDYATSYNVFLDSYNQLKENGLIDSAVLYNLGNCAYSLQRPAEALAWFKSANLISPRDSQIRENLNFVSRELGIETAPKNFSEHINKRIGYLRADEWLNLAMILFVVGLIALVVNKLNKGGKPIVFYTFLVISLYSAVCSFYIYNTSYIRKSSAIVLGNVAIYKLPLVDADRELFHINLGNEVKVLEEREIFCLIRFNGGEGWIEKKQLKFLWL